MGVSHKQQFSGSPGDTLWFRQMIHQVPHLYVVLTPPVDTPPVVVIVNLTTQTANSDDTVVLLPGDHPFIRHPTAVNYRQARPASVELLKKEIDIDAARADAPFDPEVLKRIQDGVLQSRFTPRNIKKLFVRAMGLSTDTDQ